jgi:hypothetical protein
MYLIKIMTKLFALTIPAAINTAAASSAIDAGSGKKNRPQSPIIRGRALFAAFAFFICLFAVQSASAATFTVTTTADSGAGSLRMAIASANGTTSPDTINFMIPAGSAGCTSAGVCTITLTSGELAITSATAAGTLTITNSTGASNLLISGNNTSRVFFVNGGANLTINGVTITKGNGTGTTNSGSGGGILNFGTLTLTNSIVSGNMATNGSGGGGIFVNGTLTLTNSIVSGNMATNDGGGIFNIQGTTTLTNSTVSGNAASFKGGGINNGSTLNLTGSTVSGNTASFNGGGIFNGSEGTTTLTNSTVSGNTATNDGGGIFNDQSFVTITLNLTSVTVTQNKSTNASCTTCAGGISNSDTANLKNTIVAGNTVANTSSSPDFGGGVAAGSSFNLIGNGKGTFNISNGTNSNQVGVDPKLGALANNGGATQTHALLTGSPAIDKGTSSGSSNTDQRGMMRPVDNPSIAPATGGDNADIGAFEVQAAPTAAAVSVGGRVTTATGRGIVNVRIYLTDSNGQVRTTTTTSFGYYHFEDVAAGETYIISARGKHYSFTQPLQVLSVNDETTNVNFIAYPN